MLGGGITRIAYCGTLGSSYDLTVIIDAMKLIFETEPERKKKLQFVVMGDGPRRSEFQQKASGLPVVFTGRLTYLEMVWMLSRCDIAVNPIEKGAAQSIINKHMDYAMAGLPVINTQECKEYRDLIDEYHMGLNCECANSSDVRDKLLQVIDDKELRDRLGTGARKCAEERFDRKRTYETITNLIVGKTGR